jgi:hypothetical protein
MGTVQPTRWNTTAARFQTGPLTAAELADICELAEKAAVSAVGLAWLTSHRLSRVQPYI